MPFTDNFTDTNGTALESHTPSGGSAWAKIGSNDTGKIQNNTLNNTTNLKGAYTCDDQGSANHYTQCLTVGFTGQANNYLCVRLVDEDNLIGYRLAGAGSAGRRLLTLNGGTLIDLITSQGVSGEWIKVECEGDTIRFYEGGTSGSPSWNQIGSDQTSTLHNTETSQGVRPSGDALDIYDNFEAGALGGVTDPEFIINRRRFQGTRPRYENLLEH